ncbi:MAG: class II glutamine amidotransferase [Myxococcota bacterium]
MCRLYGMRASHRTEVGCELIEAQNSLIRQSERDARGLSNPHGWGIGRWAGKFVDCQRVAEPASVDEDFRMGAATLEGKTILAHIRRATVGSPKLVNTHPFLFEHSMLAHNGHIPDFAQVRPKMLDAMTEQHRGAILGDTDSEHFFHLLLSIREREDLTMHDGLTRAVVQVYRLAKDLAPDDEVGLNFLWTEEEKLVGCRLNRELWYTKREGRHRCEVCGGYHTTAPEGADYRSTVLASEKITDSESWQEVPNASVFWIDKNEDLHIRELELRD